MKRMRREVILIIATLAVAAMSACTNDSVVEPSSSITRRTDFMQCSWTDGPNGERLNYECHIELTDGGTGCTAIGSCVDFPVKRTV